MLTFFLRNLRKVLSDTLIAVIIELSFRVLDNLIITFILLLPTLEIAKIVFLFL